jgi:hypothetical protein
MKEKKMIDIELLNYIIYYAKIGISEVINNSEIKEHDIDIVIERKTNTINELLARLKDIDKLSMKINGIK